MHGHWHHPAEGEVVNVLFNPKSREVKLADEYKVSPTRLAHADDQRFQAISDAPTGTADPRVAPGDRIIFTDGNRTVSNEPKPDTAE